MAGEENGGEEGQRCRFAGTSFVYGTIDVTRNFNGILSLNLIRKDYHGSRMRGDQSFGLRCHGDILKEQKLAYLPATLGRGVEYAFHEGVHES